MYRFHHVCLSVSDRVKSIAFYETFGFHQVHLWEAADKSLIITHLKMPDDPVILELFCYARPTPAPGSIHSTKTDLPIIGTKHFGLRVESIENTRRELIAKGLITKETTITQGRTGPRFFFVPDPDGILVEISEDPRVL